MNVQTKVNHCDVLVVGGGIAGLYAATTAIISNPKSKVMLLVADEVGSGGCSKNAQSFNAAVHPDDSIAAHIKDTMDCGGGLNNAALVKVLCTDIIDRIKELESFGVKFDRDGSRYNMRKYGGSSYGRAVQGLGITGFLITQALVQRAILNGLFIKEHHWVLNLIHADRKCSGVVAFNKKTDELEVYYAQSVILATGGGACVYPVSSVSPDKQASGIIMAFDAGASLIDMEMVQFHPTGLLLSDHSMNGALLEEEIRTQGGILLNREGQRYMLNYDPRGELATRDIVSRSTYLEVMAGRGTKNGGVILDLSQFDKNTLLRRFPNTVRRLRACDVDLLTCDTVEVSPTAHFLMGGIAIDENCATGVANLFACGEDAGGVHGGNRLGGNGLAEALVFGYRAGIAALRNAEQFAKKSEEIANLEVTYYNLDSVGRNQIKRELKKIMWDGVGVVREEKKMHRTLSAIMEIQARLQPNLKTCRVEAGVVYSSGLVPGRILFQKIQLAYLITLAACARKNSVGAHFRMESDDTLCRFNTVLRKANDGQVSITLRELPVGKCS